MLFFSLQGLGNSIMNFPLLAALRESYDVKVVSYNNGSSVFFKDFHPNVIGASTNSDFLKKVIRLKAKSSFVCYPTWKREMSAVFLPSVKQKYFVSSGGLANWFKSGAISAERGIHNLENNIRLLKKVPGIKEVDLNFCSQLKLDPHDQGKKKLAIHPTASSTCKYYPVSFWRQLLAELAGEFDELQIFCGTKEEEVKHCLEIKSVSKDSWDKRMEVHAGMPFVELANHLARAAQFIGVDSALMHLSALLDRPTMGLWSFANYKVIYPYGDRVSVYLPRETIAAKTYEYTDRTPAYVQRAEASEIVRIIRRQARASFEIQPRYKKPIAFFEY